MLVTGTTEGTRSQVLGLVLRRGRATVAELAVALALTQGAVRRHLERLRADGLVDVEALHQEMGRPVYVYRPTRAAEEARAHYERLTERFVQEVSTIQIDQVHDLAGEQLLQRVFRGVARRVAKDHEEQVSGQDLGERVGKLTEALREEGILSAWTPTDEGFHLYNTACPYRRVAHASTAACVMDREVIESLLGVPVEQIGRLVDGQPQCEYVVRAATRLARRE